MTMSLRPGICINWLSNMKIGNTVIWTKKIKLSECPIGPGKVQKTISNCLFAEILTEKISGPAVSRGGGGDGNRSN